jgi:SAM-dependent methyltransferase
LGSGQLVGDQLLAIGYTIRALGLTPPGRILEFGPGYGKLTVELAQMGHRVTAVDVFPSFLEVVARRARMIGREVEVVCSEMLGYRPAERFDRVLFYECFHHCSDHVAMIRQLDGMVAENGAVVFAGEPIEDDFPMPWGVRLDGRAALAIRLHGWLELGFRTDYFLGLLARHGWEAERLESADVRWHRVIVARRAGGR